MTTLPSTRLRLYRGNWRVALVRFVLSGLLVMVVLALLPSIDADFEAPLASIVTLAAIYALLDVFVRPLLNLLLMPFVVQSYGLALVAVDILIFALLLRFSARVLDIVGTTFTVEGLVPLLVGGLVLGVLKLATEALLGLTPPIAREEPATRDADRRP